MSRSQFVSGKKPLDTFFWVNEITGEVTYPPWKATMPAAAPETPQEKSGSQHGGVQGAPPCPQDLLAAPAQRPVPSPLPTASLKDKSSRDSLPWTPTEGQANTGARSPLQFSAFPATISAPGGALLTLGPLGLGQRSSVATFSPHPSSPWAFTCKLKNVITGNNRFSF
ncbi:uncharacterized protein C3orf86-like [Oryctolagus cuniculus]|uniref:uncharacterized protein C3orf86-like n=1 Tax=Oryctolagus cuniculus TaxID=9986 RepID=UPI00387A4FD3